MDLQHPNVATHTLAMAHMAHPLQTVGKMLDTVLKGWVAGLRNTGLLALLPALPWPELPSEFDDHDAAMPDSDFGSASSNAPAEDTGVQMDPASTGKRCIIVTRLLRIRSAPCRTGICADVMCSRCAWCSLTSAVQQCQRCWCCAGVQPAEAAAAASEPRGTQEWHEVFVAMATHWRSFGRGAQTEPDLSEAEKRGRCAFHCVSWAQEQGMHVSAALESIGNSLAQS